MPLKPEARLLLAGLADPARPSRRFDGLTEVEWTTVADLAVAHGLGPWLHATAGAVAPAAVGGPLQARAARSARRALAMQSALADLGRAAAERNITVVVLKGMHLATTIYPSPALREMNDVDVLVSRHDLDRIATLARNLGFREKQALPTEVVLGGLAHLPRMFKGAVGLEIHWRLASPPSPPDVEFEELAARAVALSPGASLQALGTEDLLIHLCAHAAAGHVFSLGLRPLVDVALVIAHAGTALDWGAVVERAVRWRVGRATALVLAMVHAHLGAAVPESTAAAFGDRWPAPSVVDAAMTFVMSDALLVGDTPEAVSAFQVQRGWGARLSLVARRWWLPPHELVTYYPWANRHALARAWARVRRTVSLVAGAGRLSAPADPARDGGLWHRRSALARWVREAPTDPRPPNRPRSSDSHSDRGPNGLE